MRITVGGQRTETLTKTDLIAQGGEGLIFRDPGHPRSQALKIYHDPTRARSKKLEAFFKAGLSLPDSVIAPESLVTDDKGRIIGFQMRWLSGRFQKISTTFKKSFCKDHGLTTKNKAEMLIGIGQDLSLIHSQGTSIGPGLIVGDLNGGSIMVHEDNLSRAWVDVDSWQLNDKFPCIVGTQMYLCPDLYGIDLSKTREFKQEHDWWSFVVLMVQALLNGVHPFKSGKHPNYKSVLARAENGMTVFDDEVSYPKIGLPPEVMTDELIEAALKILKRQEMGVFPKSVLENYFDILVECKSCGIFYPAIRTHCPGCTQKTILDTSMKVMVSGLQVVELITTIGDILHHQKIGNTLQVLSEENQQLTLHTKEDGKPATSLALNKPSESGARFKFLGNHLVVCLDPGATQPQLEIYKMISTGASLVTTTTTKVLNGGRAIFGCSPNRLYRIAGRYIMAGQIINSTLIERPVMQVFEGQTFFKVCADNFSSRDIIVGCHREFDQLNWFLVRSDSEGQKFSRYNVLVSSLESGEAIIDVAIYFSREEVLIIRKTKKHGSEFVRIDTIDTETGNVLQSKIIDLMNTTYWDNIHNKAFSKDFIMHATDDGIVREKISDGSVNDIPETDQYVTSDNELGRFGRGVMVVKNDSIVSIEPKK